MLKRFLLSIILVVALTGCATTRQKTVTNQLQTRVGELERQLDLQNEQVDNLKYEVKDLSYDLERLNSGRSRSTSSKAATSVRRKFNISDNEVVRVHVSEKDVQAALKSAGYYQGAIDGKIGLGTKEAIRKFQKDNGLKVDGFIGLKTWGELEKYLE